MRERPIIFSGEMVRAILDGRKTMTRRVIKPQPEPYHDNSLWWKKVADVFWQNGEIICDEKGKHPCPYGQPGDRLWVREAYVIKKWRKVYHLPRQRSLVELTGFYVEDGAPFCIVLTAAESKKFLRWRRKTGKRGSIYCFRSLSRLTLEVVKVRVERLQQITEDDAKAEGIEERTTSLGTRMFRDYSGPKPVFGTRPIVSFASLWDSLNAKRGFGWAVNPWVWVVEFRRVYK